MSKRYDIAVIAGDGIGPEVVREGLRVLDRVAALDGFTVDLTHYPFGAEHYLKTREIFPDTAFQEVKGRQAILLGAIGDPRIEVGLLEFGIIAKLRFELDLFVNLRPVRLFAEHLCPLKDVTPAQVDFVVVRENTEDAYAGMRGFFKKLTLIDKANAIRAMDLWTRAFAEIGAEYPDVERDHQYIDAACMYVVRNPEQYDTVVTSNMFGDIFTDLSAMIQGGLGVAASGNIHPGRVSLFEPIHGSAPKYTGRGVANPVATVMAVAMMLDYLGETRAARRIEDAVATLLRTRRLPSLGTDSGFSTTQVGDLVIEALEAARVTA
jgi:3-isopropylmalate dehydrogenase